MGASGVLLGIIAIYAAIIFAIALFVEESPSWRKRVESSPHIYALALAVYSSTWSFYGSVGLAARTGYMYAPITFGILLSATVWWIVLRRMVRFKTERRVTSIADFISARYDHSQLVAALVTVMALVGSLPYVALQMKAILSTLEIAATFPSGHGPVLRPLWLDAAGPALVVFMSVFTILVGVRRLDPTERHQGMIAAVAVESVVKLVALTAVGAYVTWSLFDGLDDIYARVEELPFEVLLGVGDGSSSAYMTWVSMLFLTMFAGLLLPRQFHVAVVENSDERHILTAMWLFPLYVFVLQLFVMPIALGGLVYGLPREAADSFVLRLPFMSGAGWLGILAFLGGLSAGMSMIVISTVTLATMITNHLLLPALDLFPRLNIFRRFLLQGRWAVVIVFLGLGYAFNVMVGDSYILVNMGIISFAAAFQFAPVVLGGLFWKGGTREGALVGLGAGFVVWGWTVLIPAFVRSGWLAASLLEVGPFGLAWLRPEALQGLEVLDPLTHTLFWSMLLNAGLYGAVSVFMGEPQEERAPRSLGDVVGCDESGGEGRTWDSHISLEDKRRLMARQFSAYYPAHKAVELSKRCAAAAGLEGMELVNIRQLMALYAEAERVLAGVIGSAAAYKTLREGSLYSTRETMELSEVYACILADLKLSPEDLAKRIDYYQEREVLLKNHADELIQANRQLVEEVAERRRTEKELAAAESNYRGIFENATEGIFQSTPDGRILGANPAFARFFGYESAEQLMREVKDMRVQHYADPAVRDRFVVAMREKNRVSGFEVLFNCRERGQRWGALHARAILDEQGQVDHFEGILEDIHDRKMAEEKILGVNRYVKDVIDSMPSAVIGLDRRGHITNWNSAAVRQLGLPGVKTDTLCLSEVFPETQPYSEVFQRAMNMRMPQHLPKVVREVDGQVRYEDVMVYPLVGGTSDGEQAVMRVDDITDRVRMEEMMVQTEKMMSVGGLAAGMAHEINNPLGGILQAVQNILRRVSDELPGNIEASEKTGVPLSKIREYLERRKILSMIEGIRDSGLRAAEIVTNMLEFSRRSASEKTRVDMANLLNTTVELASKDYGLKKSYDFRNIRIKRDFDPTLPAISCTPSEIEQVLLNLLRNAAQALPKEGDESLWPQITLRTRRDGDWVRIEVEDNGPGMDAATRKRVFEPFFTTKEAGEGTGLGLSVSYFIITTKHGGEFSVESAPGHGTTFIIRLPVRSLEVDEP
ncbi:MAG: PAS domain S-box protein [Proteobacteria bacterium]|nr:PAS domain S-box protein [Pseudomonadota bacterium]